MRPFEKTRSSNADVRAVQESTESALLALGDAQITQGRLIKSVSITAGSAARVDHKLGKAPAGWLVVGKSAEATVWDEQAANGTPARTLVLQASANVTVNLWVF